MSANSGPEVRIGTSAFTAKDWPGSFYPEGMKPAEYLAHYATQFDTVEIDSAFYRPPAVEVVKGWAAKLFALKVPQVSRTKKSAWIARARKVTLSLSFR
jgi:uncharacterized protein YecE (DUF72 family)